MIMPSPSHRPTSQASGYTSGAKPSGMAKGTSALALVELVDDVAGEPADRQGRSDQQPDEDPLEREHVPILRCRRGWPPPPTPRATAHDALRPPAYPAAMRTLVISVTSGADRPEACNQALTVAAAAVVAGVEVSLWLSGEASWLALPGRAGNIVLPHATPLADLLEVVLGEGTVTLCTQCAARRGIAGDEMLPGIRIAGATVFVEETMRPDAQALVY